MYKSSEIKYIPIGGLEAASNPEQNIISYIFRDTFETFCVNIRFTFPSIQSFINLPHSGALSDVV